MFTFGPCFNSYSSFVGLPRFLGVFSRLVEISGEKKKSILFPPVQASIARNFEILKSFMDNQQILEWVVPQGGCVCFPRIKMDVPVDVEKFHDILLNQYKTYVGRGHWFEADSRFMRIGYSWDKTEKLQKGLSNILQAISQSVR